MITSRHIDEGQLQALLERDERVPIRFNEDGEPAVYQSFPTTNRWDDMGRYL